MVPAGGALAELRRTNLEKVVSALRQGGTLSQSELARATGLSEATVSNLVRVLVQDDRVKLSKGRRNGRSVNLVELDVAAGELALTVTVAREAITAAAVDHEGLVLVELSRPRVPESPYGEERDTIVELIEAVRAADEVAPRPLAGVGLALGVSIDPVSNTVPEGLGRLPAFDSSWYGADVTGELGAETGLPVRLINDCDAALLAEVRWGAARGCRDVLYLHLSSGVGGAMLLGGLLYRGGPGGIGELGHSSTDTSGRLCLCGNRGCLETKVGGDALLSHVADLHGDDLTLGRLAELARSGDPGCVRIVTDAAQDIVTGLANVVAVLAPERFVLGGELAAAGSALLDPVSRGMRRMASPRNWRGSVVLAELGGHAIARGAARYAFDGTDLCLQSLK
ncbi:putative NBD/HSP70 family sugar kinase [Actinomadura pelletieri DSM 43383]|uniref:Putative NBD/HSP70 family sugar kinase n=1 Tax=Actinomadura pelletieri DSM 43383 TaxID=1120940 RepID=A0A495QX10_9ACTN|nr:ROK family transcriptional regulator [Actinomadura pelletieri]RKS78729.1 putative NBD/HSP70 family sugar kinase [Actinomadura pelletieri DSM 43383]